MGFPMGPGIPWESHGNGNKTQNWEWVWEGMGNHLSGNGNYLHSHGNLFPKVLCCDELIKLLVLYLPDGTDDWCGSGNSGRKWRVIGGGGGWRSIYAGARHSVPRSFYKFSRKSGFKTISPKVAHRDTLLLSDPIRFVKNVVQLSMLRNFVLDFIYNMRKDGTFCWSWTRKVVRICFLAIILRTL